jgi:multicomponent Na+:H+ antiporter subunit E
VSGADADGTAVASDGTDDAGTAEPDAAGAPKWPVVGVLLAVLWLFVRGVAPGETVEATLRTVLGEFLIGLAVGWPTAFALRRYYTPRVAVGRSLRVAPYAVLYVVVFVRELLTANVDVAYRVLAPSMPIRPDVIAIPLRVESDAAVTTIANSITLTPGTLTMDHDAGTNTLYVHAIAARNRESVVDPVRTWEDYALVIFEGRDPNTEIPRSPYGVSTVDTVGSTDGRDRPTGDAAGSEEPEEPDEPGEPDTTREAEEGGERSAEPDPDGGSPPRTPDGDGLADRDHTTEGEGGDRRGR